MHAALPLLDSGHDAVGVLHLLLHIFPAAGNQQLARLADVAGLVFIGNAHRRDVQRIEVLEETAAAAHVEHLQQSLLGHVAPVLGAALLLRNPDRAPSGGDRLSYILREQPGSQVEFSRRYASDHLYHAVGAQQVGYHAVAFEQIAAHADLGQRHLVGVERPLHESRIENYVAVVGYRQEGAVAVDIVQTVVGERGHAALDHGRHDLVHHDLLEFVHRAYVLDQPAEGAQRLVREEELGDHGQEGVLREPRKDLGHLLVVVGDYAFVFVVCHIHVHLSLRNSSELSP